MIRSFAQFLFPTTLRLFGANIHFFDRTTVLILWAKAINVGLVPTLGSALGVTIIQTKLDTIRLITRRVDDEKANID